MVNGMETLNLLQVPTAKGSRPTPTAKLLPWSIRCTAFAKRQIQVAAAEKLRVPKVGLEPTPPCGDRILSPARLPFRHFGCGGVCKGAAIQISPPGKPGQVGVRVSDRDLSCCELRIHPSETVADLGSGQKHRLGVAIKGLGDVRLECLPKSAPRMPQVSSRK